MATTMTMKLTDIGEAPFAVTLSYLDAPEISLLQQVCKEFRENSVMAWTAMEQTLQQAPESSSSSSSSCNRLGDSPTAQERCCRFYKARRYAENMEGLALQHYDFSDPEPTHVKCWCCRQFPNLNTRVFRYPHKFEFFCRISSRFLLGDDSNTSRSSNTSNNGNNNNGGDHVLWQGFRPATKISYTGLSMDVQEIFQQIKMHEAFDTYMFQADDAQDFVTMCDVTDSLMVTVVAMEKALPWRTTLVLTTGGFHDCLGMFEDSQHQTFRFHPRMARSHGILRDEDYITAGFQTSTERLGGPLQDCHLVLEHQW